MPTITIITGEVGILIIMSTIEVNGGVWTTECLENTLTTIGFSTIRTISGTIHFASIVVIPILTAGLRITMVAMNVFRIVRVLTWCIALHRTGGNE